MLYRFLAYLIIFLIFSTNLFSQKFHLILTIDNISRDIKTSCIVDGKNMEELFEDISRHTKMELKIYRTQFNFEDIKHVINNIHPDSNDVIWFFYSGHGYRYNRQQDNFPFLSVKGNEKLSLQYIHETLLNKNARLTVSMADACNSFKTGAVPIENPLNTSFTTSDQYQRLFKFSYGDFIMSSSSKGEYSYCNRYGGFFTNSFIKSFANEIDQKLSLIHI